MEGLALGGWVGKGGRGRGEGGREIICGGFFALFAVVCGVCGCLKLFAV
jgi:hypothetical protein